jgi:hypothetical protein
MHFIAHFVAVDRTRIYNFCANQKVEHTIGIIRHGKAKKDRKHNDQTKGDKWTNNDIQSTTQKSKD